VSAFPTAVSTDGSLVGVPAAAPLPAGARARRTPARAFLGRQPILNRAQQLIGYELLYRADAEATEAQFTDGGYASLTVVASLLQDLGADQVLGGKLAFVNVGPESFGEASPIDLLEPRRTVLEFESRAVIDAPLLSLLTELRKRGFGIAVTVDAPSVMRQPLFALANYAKVDLLKLSMAQMPQVVGQLRAAGSRRLLVAEKVETPEQARACLELGFDCLQGFYFARPETLSARKIEPGRAAVLRAIKLLLRNADIDEIDAALKRDVALSVKLLRYMNTAGNGQATRIESLRHAIGLLGYNNLARRLTLLLATVDTRDPTAPLLARTAVARGRLMELLGEGRFEAAQRDNLFIVGTFSLLPAMLMVPMQQALDELELPQTVAEGLLGRTGPYADYLKLAEACENPSLAGVAKLCGRLELSPGTLNQAQTEAARWVAQMGF
jgi:EAL and modified HD-GYP domain-containing signal transduction protein